MIKANDPTLQSWVEVPENSDFPIQNLPFGIFKTTHLTPRAGVAIGNQIVDLDYLYCNGFFKSLNLPEGIFNQKMLNDFIAIGKEKTRAVRERISALLQHDNAELRDNKTARKEALILMGDAEMLLPVRIGDYTDFYSSEQHAYNVGCLFRDPSNALLPNWKHIPVGYHGRASSIVVSGTTIHRPKGQQKPNDVEVPVFGPSKLMDFELEMAFVVGKSTELGESITTEEAEDHIFGVCIFNDWSARDIQGWEYVPLGPFLGKSFASSASPWIVTLDALEPFKVAGSPQDPKVLPYLEFSGDKNYDIDLEVYIRPENSEPTKVSHSNFKYMYWNMCQQLTHHTVNGCNIKVGDMMASGTISGPQPHEYGSMLELSWKGTKTIKMAD
ncbi:MAG: fumarylacetoacetase, partial [Cyclobacteriaceae bacterium]|nr:fumarylacetoacetase [Cyclobacteriaceae bacterium]